MSSPTEHDRNSIPHDPVRALLLARSCPARMVVDGFPGLITRWTEIVNQIETGYGASLDEYINDMDLRDLVSTASQLGGVSGTELEALHLVDARYLEETEACPCIWGPDVEAEDGLSSEDWWYYRRPRELTDTLRDEMERWGLV